MLNRRPSSCGRLPPKPQKKVEEEVAADDTMTIQDQIENLRIKISLKERYNKVLKENLEESRAGTNNVLRDLYTETEELRAHLQDALNAEKFAVESAIRTHRHFQLAILNKPPACAIEWIEDRIFDSSKLLNALLKELEEKRTKLKESEDMVIVLEKWPRPGSLPWERAAVENFTQLENMIEAMKVKRETAGILQSKYKEIRVILREEKGKYAPSLHNLENQYNFHKLELQNLEKMVEEADHFREDAAKYLALTEKEASENRKKRRRQMTKIKNSVHKVLEQNNQIIKVQINYTRKSYEPHQGKDVESTLANHMADRMKQKRNEVELFQESARQLVETMRVPDLTHIPKRLHTVKILGKRLLEEQDQKEVFRNLLLRHRDQLQMVLGFFKYTGYQQETIYEKAIKKSEAAVNSIQKEIEEAEHRLESLGDSTLQIKLGMIALLERLNETKKEARSRIYEMPLKIQLKYLSSKARNLHKDVKSLRLLFKGKASDKKYGSYVRESQMPQRLIRVRSPGDENVEESDNENDFADFKVPGYAEIKARSLKFIQHAKLKHGLV